MLVSTFQLHNVAKDPDNEFVLKPCCLEILRANNLLPFEAPVQSSSAIIPEATIGDCLRAFKELSKEAASVGK
ncbi:MAG: hypothetical protein GX262_08375 [Clostridia bacterium]|nr:hypothetical protein [Clostridia bacterium]